MTRPTWNGIELPGFLVTNEKDIELFLNQLRKEKDRPRLNTIDAYVATTHALRFAVESTAREFYLMDIDEQVIDFQLFLKQMVLYSQGSLQKCKHFFKWKP
jgi:hypothetical protein